MLSLRSFFNFSICLFKTFNSAFFSCSDLTLSSSNCFTCLFRVSTRLVNCSIFALSTVPCCLAFSNSDCNVFTFSCALVNCCCNVSLSLVNCVICLPRSVIFVFSLLISACFSSSDLVLSCLSCSSCCLVCCNSPVIRLIVSLSVVFCCLAFSSSPVNF